MRTAYVSIASALAASKQLGMAFLVSSPPSISVTEHLPSHGHQHTPNTPKLT
jgi:hypothetical protein